MSEKCGEYTYKEEERIGSGEYGCVYLARNEEEKEGEKKLYVIKFPLGDKMSPAQKREFDEEVKILRKLNISDNKYTSFAYDSKTFEEIEREKIEEKKEEENKIEEPEENKKKVESKTIKKAYYVMDYFSRGLLYSYVVSGTLTQRQAKFIFKKLIESFKYLHENFHILHFDIKLDNIVLDNDFTPIIIDFTFSKQYRDKDGIITPVTTLGGSDEYRAPELYEYKELMDEKADIFSLGVILFNLITSSPCFDSSKETDKLYKLIRKGDYKSYWDKMKSLNLSLDFKDLYQRMVAYKPSERPTFDEILKHPFLKDVKDLTKEEEDKIKKELENLFNKYIIYAEEEKYEENENIIKDEHLKTRTGESEEEVIFTNKDLEPKKISEDRLLLNQSMKITGDIPEVDYMNSLYRQIKNKFMNHCYIKDSRDSLKMEVEFEYDESEEEKGKEKREEKKEEEKEEKKHFEDCKMEIELLKYEKGKYLLEFIRTGGKFPDYYHHFLEIKKLISKNNINKK